MDRRLLFPAIAATAFAQQTAPPKAAEEEALRARVQQFLQLEVDKKFRQAEGLLDENAKDIYYAAAKPDIRSFRIESVNFSDDGTATVTLRLRMMVSAPAMPSQIFELGSTQSWKLVDGQWVLFVDRNARVKTPFGEFDRTKSTASNVAPLPPMGAKVDVNAFAAGVTMDRQSVTLSSGAPSQSITLKNNLPGPVSLSLREASAHLSVDIAKKELAPGESGPVTITWKDKSPDISSVRIMAAPLGQILTIKVEAK